MKGHPNRPLRPGLSVMSPTSVLITTIAVATLLFTTTAFAACEIQSEQAQKLVWNQQVGFQKIRHHIGGYLQVRGGWVDQDRRRASITTKKARSGLYLEEAELRYCLEGQDHRGFGYGAKLELNVGIGNDFVVDEAVVYFKSDRWGRLEFGAEDGAEDALEVGGDRVAPGTGLYDGDFTVYLNEQMTFGNASIAPNVANDSGDNIKLSYYTPRVAGFKFGVSYTPKVYNEGVTDPRETYYDHIGMGANYIREFGGDNSFKASVHYSSARHKRQNEPYLDSVFPELSDERSLHAATSLALENYEFSVNASLLGDGGFESRGRGDNGWNTGAIVAYNYGAGKIGIGAAYAEATNALGKHDEITYLGLAADYYLNDYIKFVADIHHIDSSRGGFKENDALIFVAGTEVSF